MKVSIIVPVYNAEPYMSRCLNSLINQTLSDIEIICINDGSYDSSLAILKEYAQRDSRVKIINSKKNCGEPITRNKGLKISEGEYIGFCDSDDYVDLDFYEKLYEFAKSKNADIAKGNIKILEWKTKIERVIDNYSSQMPKYFFSWSFTTGIYRKSMLKKHSVKFPVANVINACDIVFLNHAVIVARKVVFLNGLYYHYITRSNSLDSTNLSMKKIRSILHCRTLISNRLNASIISKSHYCHVYRENIRATINLISRTSSADAIEEITKSVVKFYKKYKFPEKLNLPKPIVTAIENEDEKKRGGGLRKWEHCGDYPFIDIKESILRSRNLYVWGIGEDGIKVKKQCEINGWKISGFLDSNKNINKYNRYKVERPEQILSKSKRDFFIVISSRKYEKEIAEICRKAGLKKGENFWTPKEL